MEPDSDTDSDTEPNMEEVCVGGVRTRKRKQDIKQTIKENADILDGLELVDGGEYVRVDRTLINRLRNRARRKCNCARAGHVSNGDALLKRRECAC